MAVVSEQWSEVGDEGEDEGFKGFLILIIHFNGDIDIFSLTCTRIRILFANIMNIKTIITQSEGRRLEFKETLPGRSDLSKTVVAFANDAGGDIYLGIRDAPREVIGIAEHELVAIEEQISDLIYSRCYPGILPEISFLSVDDKHLIKVSIYRGSMPPYYVKDKGKLHGTYIRVGSTNRLADEAIIAELERRKRNVSYDSEIIIDKLAEAIHIDSFNSIFKEKTGEELSQQTLRKLELTKENQGMIYPTVALVLFSDDELRNSLFHYAKVECARFKGVSSEEFIDQKSIFSNIATQAEEAYNFVLRHINKGAVVEGVYTLSRWEYPIKAIREVIRNAVVHRDYSLTGKDIKVAIYDDMVEITSPGLLPPSIDYAEMDSRQSDAKNKVIAPMFKLLGIIDQWGNGLKLIAEELKEYPEIEFRWKEVGLSFQVQFIKLNYKQQQLPEQELGQELGQELRQDLGEEQKKITFFSLILQQLQVQPLSRSEMKEAFGLKKVSGYLNRTILKLQSYQLIAQTIPENPNHPGQKFQITSRGTNFIQLVERNK